MALLESQRQLVPSSPSPSLLFWPLLPKIWKYLKLLFRSNTCPDTRLWFCIIWPTKAIIICYGSKLGCQKERTMCDICHFLIGLLNQCQIVEWCVISVADESKMLLRTAGFVGMPGGTPPLVVASGRAKSFVPSCTISTGFDIKPFEWPENTELYTCTLSARITHDKIRCQSDYILW